MKGFKQFLCLFLAAVMLTATPAFAVEATAAAGNSSRSSNYFGCSTVYLYKTSDTTFQAWFDVGAVDIMDELGATVIKIQRSTDGVNWDTMRTYRSSVYSGMICLNTAAHAYGVTYTAATPGCYYRAYIVLYAAKDNGTAEWYRYTSVMQM